MAFTDVFRKANYSIENSSTIMVSRPKKLVSIEKEAMLSIVPVAHLFLVFQIMIEDCLLICEDKACLTPQTFLLCLLFNILIYHQSCSYSLQEQGYLMK